MIGRKKPKLPNRGSFSDDQLLLIASLAAQLRQRESNACDTIAILLLLAVSELGVGDLEQAVNLLVHVIVNLMETAEIIPPQHRDEDDLVAVLGPRGAAQVRRMYALARSGQL